MKFSLDLHSERTLLSKSVNTAFDIALAKEIHHLTTLRDTLLPKLMSGEIDVNVATEKVDTRR